MLTDPTTFSLDELAAAADVPARTVRYYISQGLLPSTGTRGPKTRYEQGHLSRLQLIKRLQRRHLPLAEIRRQLDALDDEAVEMALRSTPAEPQRGSALDYVQGLLHRGVSGMVSPSEASPMLFDAIPNASAAAPSPGEPARVTRARAPAPPTTIPNDPQPATVHRYPITTAIEIHAKQPLDSQQSTLLARLLEAARRITEEE